MRALTALSNMGRRTITDPIDLRKNVIKLSNGHAISLIYWYGLVRLNKMNFPLGTSTPCAPYSPFRMCITEYAVPINANNLLHSPTMPAFRCVDQLLEKSDIGFRPCWLRSPSTWCLTKGQRTEISGAMGAAVAAQRGGGKVMRLP
jgi:hypothetical protein